MYGLCTYMYVFVLCLGMYSIVLVVIHHQHHHLLVVYIQMYTHILSVHYAVYCIHIGSIDQLCHSYSNGTSVVKKRNILPGRVINLLPCPSLSLELGIQ